MLIVNLEILVLFFKTGSQVTQLTLNSLYSLEWPWTSDPPSQALGLWIWTTTPDFTSNWAENPGPSGTLGKRFTTKVTSSSPTSSIWPLRDSQRFTWPWENKPANMADRRTCWANGKLSKASDVATAMLLLECTLRKKAVNTWARV